MSAGAGRVNEDELKLSLVGICRDLRGVVSVFNSRTAYLMLFEWMYPKNGLHIMCVLKCDVVWCGVVWCDVLLEVVLAVLLDNHTSYPSYIEVLLQALTIWYHDPSITTPILKFIAELVLNR